MSTTTLLTQHNTQTTQVSSLEEGIKGVWSSNHYKNNSNATLQNNNNKQYARTWEKGEPPLSRYEGKEEQTSNNYYHNK